MAQVTKEQTSGHGVVRDQRGQDQPKDKKRAQQVKPAGPHAKPHLTDKNKTPGTGTLPEENDDSTTGKTKAPREGAGLRGTQHLSP